MANYNLGNPSAPDIMTETLMNVGADARQRIKRIHFVDGYASITMDDESEQIYDRAVKKLLSSEEWYEKAHSFWQMRETERKTALEKIGLWESYKAITDWLSDHDTVRQTQSNADIKGPNCDYIVVNRKLKYGYQIKGIWFAGADVIYEIVVYDRAIQLNSQLIGLDSVFLMYRDGAVLEADMHCAEDTVTFQEIGKIRGKETVEEDSKNGMHIRDEVICAGKRGVILVAIDDIVRVVFEDGGTLSASAEDVEKTGRRLDRIEDIFERMEE